MVLLGGGICTFFHGCIRLLRRTSRSLVVFFPFPGGALVYLALVCFLLSFSSMSLIMALMVLRALAVSLGLPLIANTRSSSSVCFVFISTLYSVFILLILSPPAPINLAAVCLAVLISFVSRSSSRASISVKAGLDAGGEVSQGLSVSESDGMVIGVNSGCLGVGAELTGDGGVGHRPAGWDLLLVLLSWGG